jgi:pyruvate/2-oxoglutarate dehydrogenase complex dihydrolipoamide acyltransferase (E2) component
MRKPILLPDLGPVSVVLSTWLADVGDFVYHGDRMVEVLIDGATFDVASPATGRLVERYAMIDEALRTGQLLGEVEEDDSA